MKRFFIKAISSCLGGEQTRHGSHRCSLLQPSGIWVFFFLSTSTFHGILFPKSGCSVLCRIHAYFKARVSQGPSVHVWRWCEHESFVSKAPSVFEAFLRPCIGRALVLPATLERTWAGLLVFICKGGSGSCGRIRCVDALPLLHRALGAGAGTKPVPPKCGSKTPDQTTASLRVRRASELGDEAHRYCSAVSLPLLPT